MSSETAVQADINAEHPEELYSKAEEYWASAPRDDDGMLGGFSQLHRPDITQSRSFLSSLHKRGALRHNEYALDCGAGIGRVTKHLLLPAFKKVDMVDVVAELVSKSDSYIGPNPAMGEKFVCGLQDFTPEPARYDLIWVQWVSGHLTNADFVSFFQRCQGGLRQGGIICLKDNLASTKEPVFDSEDHSWTRPEALIEQLLDESGLFIINRAIQKGFPKGMYKVTMFAMKPKSTAAPQPIAEPRKNEPTLI